MPSHPPRILILRGGAIGDFLLTLPALRLLREGFPDAHLEILGYPHIATLALRSGWADAIRPIESATLAPFFARNADLPEPMKNYIAGFAQIISYLYDPDGIFRDNIARCSTRPFLAADPRICGDSHAARQLAAPLAQLALFLDDPAPRLDPHPDDSDAADRFLPGKARPSIAIHPGSGSEQKNWPIDRWHALAQKLLALHPGLPLLLIGGEADTARLAALRDGLPQGSFLEAVGLPLPELAALIARTGWFIGHDSGISHLAAATGTPCTLLFGPTDPAVWGPKNRGARCLRHPSGNLAALGVEEVLATAPTRWDQPDLARQPARAIAQPTASDRASETPETF